jgi:hypothetical protein
LIGGRGQSQSSGRVGHNGEGREAAILQQQHGNWEPTKVLELISYKHVEQIVQRELIDPHMHMVPFVQRWENIANEL